MHLDGRLLFRGVVDPQAAVQPVAPGPDRAVRLEGHAVLVARHDRHDVREISYGPGAQHLHGCVTVGGGVVAELAVAVATPGPDRTVRLEGDAVVFSGVGLNELPEKSGSAFADHLHGHASPGCGAVAKSSGTILAPSPHGTVRQDCDRMLFAPGHPHDVAEKADVVRAVGLDGKQPMRGRVVAQTAVAVGAPSPEGIVGVERERMVITSGDGNDIPQETRTGRVQHLGHDG